MEKYVCDRYDYVVSWINDYGTLEMETFSLRDKREKGSTRKSPEQVWDECYSKRDWVREGSNEFQIEYLPMSVVTLKHPMEGFGLNPFASLIEPPHQTPVEEVA